MGLLDRIRRGGHTRTDKAYPDEQMKAALDRQLAVFDQIEALPHKWAELYAKEYAGLHPLVQARLSLRLPSELREDAPKDILFSAALQILSWCDPTGAHMRLDPQAQALAAQYRDDLPSLWEQYTAAEEKLRYTLETTSQTIQSAWDKAIAQTESLPMPLRGLVSRELARRGAARGQCWLYLEGVSSPPFQVSERTEESTAFAICRDCFASPDPLLFFLPRALEEEETLASLEDAPADARVERVWDLIEAQSKGIAAVRTQGPCVLFHLYGEKEHVLFWPDGKRTCCVLGEVTDGTLVPLLTDMLGKMPVIENGGD